MSRQDCRRGVHRDLGDDDRGEIVGHDLSIVDLLDDLGVVVHLDPQQLRCFVSGEQVGHCHTNRSSPGLSRMRFTKARDRVPTISTFVLGGTFNAMASNASSDVTASTA